MEVLHEAPGGYVSAEEYSQQTPESLSIPVLHFSCKQADFHCTHALGPLDGAQPVDVFIASDKFVLFQPGKAGLAIRYENITLHALQSSPSPDVSFDRCLYLQLENLPFSRAESISEEDDDLAELRIAPTDKDTLQAMFDALSTCSSLHPDPEMEDLADGNNEWITAENFADANGQNDHDDEKEGPERKYMRTTDT